MKTKKKKKQPEIPLEKRHSYVNTSLTKYSWIIGKYWADYNSLLREYESNIMVADDIDSRVIKLIRNLKKIDRWKSNLFILYLHFHKTRKLAEVLNVNPSSLSVYISNIKKELKC